MNSWGYPIQARRCGLAAQSLKRCLNSFSALPVEPGSAEEGLERARARMGDRAEQYVGRPHTWARLKRIEGYLCGVFKPLCGGFRGF